MDGAAFLTKAELMRRADASGLASRPGAIYGGFGAVVHDTVFLLVSLPSGGTLWGSKSGVYEQPSCSGCKRCRN